MPLVSVIVVNWNRQELLRQCLESLERQTLSDRDIIVVDNGSTDGSPELVQQRFPRARLLRLSENQGFSTGVNVGIRHAAGKYLALLNNDAVADPRWLDALVSAMEQHPDVGSCASRMLWYDEPEVINSAGIVFFTAGLASDRGRMARDGPPFDQPAYVFGACAGAALYRKSMLDEIGGFDEDFSPAYFEDVDLSFRAQLRGYGCLYVPSAIVSHRVSATLGYRSSASVYLWARNQWCPLIKNMPTWLMVKHAPEIILYALIDLFVHLIRDGSPYLAGQLAAWRQLPVMVKKRRQIQRSRAISCKALDAFLSRGRLASDVKRYVSNRWVALIKRVPGVSRNQIRPHVVASPVLHPAPHRRL